MILRAAPLLAAVLIAGASPAQQNLFELWCGHGAFSSRGHTPPARDGEPCTRVPAAWFCSVGALWDPNASAVVGRATGFQVLIQDQDPASQEPFSLALLAENTAVPGEPDPSVAGDLLRIGGLVAPLGSGGPTAWVIRVGLATPFDGVPCDRDWFLSAGLPANPTWPGDGLTVHIGRVGFGDDPIGGGAARTHLACSIDRGGIPIVRTQFDRTIRVGLLTEAPLLAAGTLTSPLRTNPQPTQYGIGGIYPDHSGACDTLAFRVRRPGPGVAWVLGQFMPFAPPTAMGALANLCLPIIPPPFVVPTPANIPAGATEGETTMSSLCTAWGRMSFQAIDLSGPVQFTNAVGVLSQ